MFEYNLTSDATAVCDFEPTLFQTQRRNLKMSLYDDKNLSTLISNLTEQ